jgi:3-oxoacyl-[acyl-carrier-protein] synthase II
MKSTWEGVLRTREDSDDDLRRSRGSVGITSLYHALQQQDLSPAQFEKEWETIRTSSCKVSASVPNEWITNHPRVVADSSGEDPPPPWLDGRTSRFVQLALIAAREAIRDSGVDDYLGCDDDRSSRETGKTSRSTLEGRRESYGVCVGNGMSSTRDVAAAAGSPRRISPHFVPRILPNSPSARVAIHNRLRGPNLCHAEACAAGAAAVAQAAELIRSGGATGMVAGGCESAVEALGLAGFGRLRALSAYDVGAVDDDRRDEDGNERRHRAARASSRPFDAGRDGFVLAEGAAMLVLEEYEHAIARGAPILAEVLGVGYSGDAFHITAPEPTGGGAARAMLRAADDAGIGGMEDVDYVNAHATSTPMGDLAEINAIRLALSRTKSGYEDGMPPPLLVSSTKGATGHLLGAAGALEAALTVRAVSENMAPHTRNLDVISDDIAQALGKSTDDPTMPPRRSIHLVQRGPIPRTINVAMSNSFGFGGTNVSLLFGKAK